MSAATTSLASLTADERETVEQGLPCLDAVGASCIPALAYTPAGTPYLVAMVFVGNEGSVEVTTEDLALSDHPLGFQCLALVSRLRDLAERLTP